MDEFVIIQGGAWAAAVGALLLAGLAAAVLHLRQTPRRRSMRLMAVLLVLVGLAGLALRPASWQSVPSGDVLVAVDGASEDSLRRLAHTLGVDTLYTLAPSLGWEDLPVIRLHRAQQLTRRVGADATIHVVGPGLRLDDVRALNGHAIVPHDTAALAGVRWASAPDRVSLGKPVVVAGRGYGLTGQVQLWGPSGAVDSVAVASGDSAFELRDVPRVAGEARYVVRSRTADGRIVDDSLGVAVDAPTPLHLLILQGAPGFESRHLATWLGEQGGAVAVRTSTSRDRVHAAFIGSAERDLRRISPDLLASFDVVWIDVRAFDGLSGRERGALERAVREGGLGLLTDAATAGRLWRGAGGPFALAEAPGAAAGDERRSVLRADEAGVPVRTSGDGTAWTVAWWPLGRGRLAASVADDTYASRLAGDSLAYAAFWSDVLGAVRRPTDADRWDVLDGVPRVDAPVRLRLQTAAAVPKAFVAGVDTVRLPLRQDPVTGVWDATFWPREAGWHSVWQEGNDEHAFLVVADGAWKAWEHQRVRDVLTTGLAAPSSAEAPVRRPVPWPMWPFALCVLAGAAALWTEERFGS